MISYYGIGLIDSLEDAGGIIIYAGCKQKSRAVFQSCESIWTHTFHGITWTPKLLALPTIILATDSSGIVFICSSVALIFAISKTCFREMVPMISCPGRPVPFSIPAACLTKYDAGGVFVMNVKVRSGCTVMRVGTGTPGAICAVLALNSLQKSIDFTPRAPSAGPTGGVGAALPAGMSNR